MLPCRLDKALAGPGPGGNAPPPNPNAPAPVKPRLLVYALDGTAKLP